MASEAHPVVGREMSIGTCRSSRNRRAARKMWKARASRIASFSDTNLFSNEMLSGKEQKSLGRCHLFSNAFSTAKVKPASWWLVQRPEVHLAANGISQRRTE